MLACCWKPLTGRIGEKRACLTCRERSQNRAPNQPAGWNVNDSTGGGARGGRGPPSHKTDPREPDEGGGLTGIPWFLDASHNQQVYWNNNIPRTRAGWRSREYAQEKMA